MASPSNHAKSDSYSSSSRLFGAAAGTLTAFCVNLPFETATTRLQISNKQLNTMNKVELYKMLFNSEYKGIRQFPKHVTSLANGFSAGISYKLVQGTFRYYTQPTIKQFFHQNQNIHSFFHRTFGEKFSKPMMEATAGSTTGLLEVLLLPLDTIKKVCMANEHRIRSSDIFRMLINENMRLYRGANWTAARNITGSFFQFGGYAFTMRYWFNLEDYRDATKSQIATASLVGGVAMTSLTNPFEVLKVRRQTKKPADGVKGISYLFKGTTLKVLTKSPIATLSLFFYHYYAQWYEKQFLGQLIPSPVFSAAMEGIEAKAKAEEPTR